MIGDERIHVRILDIRESGTVLHAQAKRDRNLLVELPVGRDGQSADRGCRRERDIEVRDPGQVGAIGIHLQPDGQRRLIPVVADPGGAAVELLGLDAPFLVFDSDPYLVIAGGQMWWMHDAYTTGSKYPYSVYRGGANYFRNSVKVVTSAYDGSVTFYVVDETDPVILTLQRIYPGLFAKSVAEMPAELRGHIRYPEDIFRVQVDVFTAFHMTDPQEFYNRGDLWRVANEILEQGGAPRPIAPYLPVNMPSARRRNCWEIIAVRPAIGMRRSMRRGRSASPGGWPPPTSRRSGIPRGCCPPP